MILNDGTPYYLQLARIVRARIVGGGYAPGSRLPGEQELATEFNVSKDVVRVSLRMLAEEGLLLRIRSKGTFVADRPTPTGPRRVLLTVCQNPLAVDRLRCGVENGIGDRSCETVIQRVHPSDLAVERRVLEQAEISTFSLIVATPAVDLDDSDNRRLFASIAKRGIPVVTVDHQFTDIPVDAVFFDEYGSMKRLADEVTADAGGDRTAIFLTRSQHRIVRERNRALIESAARGGDVDVIELDEPTLDATRCAIGYMQRLTELKLNCDRMIFAGNRAAWETFRLMRDAGFTDRVKVIGAVGDTRIGDSDFNSRLVCHYRLYDDFIDPLAEMISLRLDNRIPAGMSMVRMIKFRPMTAAAIGAYFENSFSSGL